jgi:integrase/recombinase XerD
MRDRNLIGTWIRRFLLEHLVADRNLSSNTQASYRDTLLLLLPFVSRARRVPIDRLIINDLSPSVLRSFLEHLEKERGCSGTTRNLRLAAVHSLAKFIGMRSPEDLAWSSDIRAVPFKRTQKSSLIYLDKPEVDSLLKAPDLQTSQGRRDYALLLFLYNTGARADEAARLTIGDITWGSSPSVRIVGKGNKMRVCPLWKRTADELRLLAAARTAGEFVFLNRRNERLTRFGIYSLVRRAVTKASSEWPALASKRISPHCLRHSCAVHLLRSGVDINTIRAWLGHVSLDTTHIYAEVDLAMKEKALTLCDLPSYGGTRAWHSAPKLMEFLRTL